MVKITGGMGGAIGLFQQTPPRWGTEAQLHDSAYATGVFLNRLLALRYRGAAAPEVRRLKDLLSAPNDPRYWNLVLNTVQRRNGTDLSGRAGTALVAATPTRQRSQPTFPSQRFEG
jgi:hypothetical protein